MTYSQSYLDDYDTTIGQNNTEFFNGTLHYNKLLPVKGEHIYMVNTYTIGNIVFKGQEYKISIKYDILNDNVITTYKNDTEVLPIKLTSSLISEFTNDSKRFVKIPYHKNIDKIYHNGFFELKYSTKKATLYIKHLKMAQSVLNGSSVRYNFKHMTYFVIFKHNQYYLVKRKKDVFSIFPEYKKLYKFHFNSQITEDTLVKFIKLINTQI